MKTCAGLGSFIVLLILCCVNVQSAAEPLRLAVVKVQSASDALRCAKLQVNTAPFWVSTGSLPQLKSEYISPLRARKFLSRGFWSILSMPVTQSMRPVIDGRKSALLTIVRSNDGQIVQIKAVFLEPAIGHPPEIFNRQAALLNQLSNDDRMRIGDIRDLRLLLRQQRSEKIANKASHVPLAAILPYGEYEKKFEPNSWLFAVSPRRLVTVIRERSIDCRLITTLYDAGSGQFLSQNVQHNTAVPLAMQSQKASVHVRPRFQKYFARHSLDKCW